MTRHRLTPTLFLALGAAAPLACGDSPTAPPYDPEIPAVFVAEVTNPFFPLAPGTTYTYKGETEDGTETIVVEVLPTTRTIMGVVARVVRDRVYLEGELVEDTWDWYAQDTEGNVWYLGEDSKEMENGQVVSTKGSWEWGEDGALPGVVMWGDPSAKLGEDYRQEFYKGQAEDWGKVVSLSESVSVPQGNYGGCLKTEEWNALDKGTREAKYYCPGVGFVKEMLIKGGSEVVELVSVAGA